MKADWFKRCRESHTGRFDVEQCGWPESDPEVHMLHPIFRTVSGEVMLDHETPSYNWSTRASDDVAKYALLHNMV